MILSNSTCTSILRPLSPTETGEIHPLWVSQTCAPHFTSGRNSRGPCVPLPARSQRQHLCTASKSRRGAARQLSNNESGHSMMHLLMCVCCSLHVTESRPIAQVSGKFDMNHERSCFAVCNALQSACRSLSPASEQGMPISSPHCDILELMSQTTLCEIDRDPYWRAHQPVRSAVSRSARVAHIIGPSSQ